MKVFISVDMEGISGVVTSEECSREGKDYQLFRTIMTEET
ncbi:MAG: M55 family metallopeptidase, partial [Acidobacteria bacterium]|nr:M55 family metallopeptidase [Acidobacteriota bacterium]